jgi:hypothetical protein
MRFVNQTIQLFLVLTLMVSTATSLFAQDNVGIGTTTPHENAILDIESTEKGLLTPRLNTLQRVLLVPVANADGLLVYDTDLDEFCYWDGAQWICLPAIGSVGPAGPTGVDGVAGPAGADGAAGVAGANGATGPNGADGATGANGIDGATGPAGIDGAAGVTGADGPTGPAGGTGGATGPTGIDGAAGVTGADGPTGATGPAGTGDLVSGVVSDAGAILSGSDFTTTQVGTGQYDITFTTPFTGGTPSINVTPVQSSIVLGGAPPATICDPCYTDDGIGADDYISNVTFNTINNTTIYPDNGCSYEDNTGINTTVVQGSSYNLTVTFWSDGTWTEFVSVWFDWNQDGDFDATERTDLGSGIDATLTLSIPIPVTALIGPTRMRVNEDWGAFATDACNTVSSGFGETEDYTVIVSDGSLGPITLCNISSATTAGFSCNCTDLTATPTDTEFHFTSVGN